MSPSDPRAPSRSLTARLVVALVALVLILPSTVAAATGSYTNPILPEIPGDGVVESCADPSVIQGQEGETEDGELLWFMYCTTDPLNDEDQNAEGDYNFHLIPMFSSTDLVNWTYEGDAFAERPDWVADDAGMWAPEITYFNGQYYLYYAASWTDEGGSAIGVATAPTALGPWTDSGDPVVDPICVNPNDPNDCQWVFDPEVNVDEEGVRWLFFGSYYGGIRARQLTDDGLESLPETQVQITIDNRYEGAEVVYRDGYYYLFVSASNCCNGPLTGYSVFVGRSETLTGEYFDQTGVSLLDVNVGGTPVIYQNGNQYIGVGHNTVFQDASGQWWTIYHAVDVNDPYFEDAVGFTKRPAMLDAIDWVDGWPVLNGGSGPSAGGHKAPAAQEGDKSNYRVRLARTFEIGDLLVEYSDEFNDGTLSDQWSWTDGAFGTLTGEFLQLAIQQADLHIDSNTASVLVQDAPSGDWMLETRVSLNIPDTCCFNYSQVGVVLYDDDDNYIKAVEFALWNTRQVEFAKEVGPVPEGYARYGNLVAGPAGEEWTWIRIVKTTGGSASVGGVYGGPERYTIYTSIDGETWVRGGTWAGHLGPDLQIGLVAMAAPFEGLTADVDYVRVYEIQK